MNMPIPTDVILSPPVKRLWIAVLAGYLALGATIQEIPTFVVERFSGGAILSGTAVGIAFLATALVRPFAGLLADHGRSRNVVALGGIFGAVGGLGHLLAQNPAELLVARLLMGAGEAALFSGAIPWVLSGFGSNMRGKIAGWFGLSMWGGLSLGPIIAELVDARAGYQGVWWIVTGLGVLSAALVLSTPLQRHGRSVIHWPRKVSDIVPNMAVYPGIVFGLAAYGYGTVSALIVLRLRFPGIGGDNLALPLFALGFLVTRIVGSPLVDRYGGERVIIGSLVVEAIGLILAGIANLEIITLIGAVLAGVGVSLTYPATVANTLRRTGPIRPGTAVGVVTSFWDLGILAAGPIGGVVAVTVGFGPAFLLSSFLSIVAIFLTAKTIQAMGDSA